MESENLNQGSLWRRYPKAFRVASAVIAGLLTLAFLCVVTFLGSVLTGLPDVHKLDQYDPAQTTKIYSRDGTLVATLFDQNRTPVRLEEVSQVMQQAMVAIEDRRFFEHKGVDLKGIGRAAMGNFASGEVEQGASTLTMQLARRLFLNNERSYSRKLREAVLAYRIDSTLSKEKILELYLNEVYYGAGAYGIDAAASLYFQLNPKDLNLWQSAMLAGIVQAPSAFSPLEDKKAALERMDEVLQAMEDDEKITAAQRAKAREQAAAYEFKNHGMKLSDGMLKYPYFTTYAVRQLSEHFPENYIRRGGLQVYTTLDIDLQEAAELAVAREVTGQGYQMGADAGAAVVLDNETGELLAMVGGTEWNTENQFNRAWQARRQPGSAFKMFVYAAGLEAGFSPEQELADTEAVFNPGTGYDWKPANSDGKFMGPIPLRSGLQFSRNLVAAKLAAHVGPARVAALAQRMGIEQDLPEVISLSLGAGEITLLEMARAYSVLPNGGVLKPNRVILKVTDPHGELVKDFTEEEVDGDRVLSSQTAVQMCEMLRRVVTGGTGTAASVPGAFIAGKTGTTDEFVDAWFMGFSAHHTIGVWIGRDDNKPMGRVYGGTIPADIFRSIVEQALAREGNEVTLPGVTFTEPVSVELCWDSTYLALPSCGRTYHETFSAGIVPSRPCPLHRQTKQKVVVLKNEDGALTNLDSEGLLASPTPEPVVEEGIDPRQDPEVVTPAGAIVPYQEKQPPGSVKVVKIKVEKEYPTATDEEKPDQSEEDAGLPEGEGQMILLEENDAPAAPTATNPLPAVGQPPAQGQPTESPDPASEEGGINRFEVERPQPVAPPSPAGEAAQPAQGQTTEVIYTNQDLEIPADPVEEE